MERFNYLAFEALKLEIKQVIQVIIMTNLVDAECDIQLETDEVSQGACIYRYVITKLYCLFSSLVCFDDITFILFLLLIFMCHLNRILLLQSILYDCQAQIMGIFRKGLRFDRNQSNHAHYNM